MPRWGRPEPAPPLASNHLDTELLTRTPNHEHGHYSLVLWIPACQFYWWWIMLTIHCVTQLAEINLYCMIQADSFESKKLKNILAWQWKICDAIKKKLFLIIREVDSILDSWLNDVMFQDGFQDILGQPLVDGTLLVMTVSYVEVYQVVLDIMLGQSLKSILNDVFNNFPIILLPTIVMVQLSRVLLKILMGRIMVMNAILIAEIYT